MTRMNAAEIIDTISEILRLSPVPYHRETVRRALLAMLDAIREPSEAMIENDAISDITIDAARAIHSSELPCAVIWRAMIDALKQEMVE